MKRVALLMVLIVAFALSGASATYGVQPQPRSSRVVLVLAPYLEWDDIDPALAPTIYRLADQGAVGNINLRNRSRLATASSPLQGALTFSAGSWAAADPLAPQPHSVDEHYEGGSAFDAYARATGIDASGYDVVFLGLPRTARLNETAATLAVRLGALGQAVRDGGGATAALGNSDAGYEVRGIWRNRPAGVVAMDEEGRVLLGNVSSDLLANDPEAPFGFATDLKAFASEYERVLGGLSAQGGPSFIVLDTGDTHRAHEVAMDVSPSVAEVHHRAAVAKLDGVVALAADSLPDDGVLMVVPQILAEYPGTVTGLGPAIISGPGWSGYLSSSSTQRSGLVTNLDIAATVLNELGLDAPVEVLGNPMVSDGSGANVANRIDDLTAENNTAVAIDTAKPVVVNTFIAGTTLVLLLCTVVLLRARLWPQRTVRRVSWAGRALLILALAVPPASLLMFLLNRLPATTSEAYMAFFSALGVVWVLGLVLESVMGPRVPVIALSLLTVGIIVADQLLGAPLSFTSFLGYSPLLAARYYGLGNEGAAILFGASVVGCGLMLDECQETRWVQMMSRWGIALLGLGVVVVAAAPMLGANVAVAVWAVVGFAAMWLIYHEVKVGWRAVLVAALLIVLLVGVFSFIDLRADTGSRSHLARAWESMGKGGVSQLWLIVVRKAETNVRVLTRTNWSWVLVAVLAFLAFMRWRPQGDFAATLQENPGFSAAVAASLIGGLTAYVTEDSGIVIPALIMVYVGVGILHLMLWRLPSSSSFDEGGESPC
ncbi:MAG: hypothetical protein RBS78_07340 [Coriobacteriia bacterium]|jgi:hypothetical protein|nr:hypothetical protein [Coriobacteriia bacterium]